MVKCGSTTVVYIHNLYLYYNHKNIIRIQLVSHHWIVTLARKGVQTPSVDTPKCAQRLPG